jgi:hypothetical protein
MHILKMELMVVKDISSGTWNKTMDGNSEVPSLWYGKSACGTPPSWPLSGSHNFIDWWHHNFNLEKVSHNGSVFQESVFKWKSKAKMNNAKSKWLTLCLALCFIGHRHIYTFQCKMKHTEFVFALEFTLLRIRKIDFVSMIIWLQNW